jgi:hypothetical protein
MSWFEDALTAADPALTAAPGLRGLEPADRPRLKPTDPRSLEGSCNLDLQLRPSRPDESRWNYAGAYAGKVWFVEVHPASSSGNIDELVKKARWLRQLTAGPLWDRRKALCWVASGPVSADPAFSRKRRLLAESGVVGPVTALQLR